MKAFIKSKLIHQIQYFLIDQNNDFKNSFLMLLH